MFEAGGFGKHNSRADKGNCSQPIMWIHHQSRLTTVIVNSVDDCLRHPLIQQKSCLMDVSKWALIPGGPRKPRASGGDVIIQTKLLRCVRDPHHSA